jgi:hypothetical protein
MQLLRLENSGLVGVNKRPEEGRFKWPPIMDGLKCCRRGSWRRCSIMHIDVVSHRAGRAIRATP